MLAPPKQWCRHQQQFNGNKPRDKAKSPDEHLGNRRPNGPHPIARVARPHTRLKVQAD
jgi:hypothetical protein